MSPPPNPARIALKTINVILGLIVGVLTVLVVSIAVEQGNYGPMLSALVETAAFVGFVWVLLKSVKTFDAGHVGGAYLLSIGGFFVATTLSLGACFATVTETPCASEWALGCV